ncbi:hypothetical protein [Streptomyces sp. NBC_00286]|uniref:hypothetical protein n=1 Tax=Streptomyces sp. NBC_00286 TaxID=2975701 RepID=UPI003FA6CF1D
MTTSGSASATSTPWAVTRVLKNRNAGLYLGAAVVSGFGSSAMWLPCVLIAALTAVRRETPDDLLGRTTATANTLMFAPNAVGLAPGAGLSNWSTTRCCWWRSG